jgi:protein-S-isoprenylcysteine O-methyltransferase Ste14
VTRIYQAACSKAPARPGWRRAAESDFYDAALRISFAAWCMLLTAYYTCNAGALLLHYAATGWSVRGAAVLLSRCCLCSFLMLVAWITLSRARPVAKAKGVLPRLTAALGTYLIYGAALLPMPHLGTFWLILSALMLTVGNALSLVILTRLARSFSIMPEARRLVTDGPYAVIRHPLYLAEQIATFGVYLQFASPAAAALCAAQLLCQIQRMRNEEAVLERAFADYAAYRQRTARLIPGVW